MLNHVFVVCFLKGECHAIKQDVYSNVINVCSPPNSWTFFYQKSIHTTRSSVFKGIISQNYDFMSIPMATPCCPRQTTHRVYCVSVILPNSQCWDVKNTVINVTISLNLKIQQLGQPWHPTWSWLLSLLWPSSSWLADQLRHMHIYTPPPTPFSPYPPFTSPWVVFPALHLSAQHQSGALLTPGAHYAFVRFNKTFFKHAYHY